ncbi:histone-fold-containing protein, partial [Mycena leptocephala]
SGTSRAHGGNAGGDTRTSRFAEADLTFSARKFHRKLKKGRYAKFISEPTSVFTAAVLEYLTAEVLEVARNVAQDAKKKRITPRHIQLAVCEDEDLGKARTLHCFSFSFI